VHEDAKANAFSNFFCLCLRDSAKYQVAPLRGFPHAVGIMKNLGISEVPSGWIALFQNSGDSFIVFSINTNITRKNHFKNVFHVFLNIMKNDFLKLHKQYKQPP
jgi:hypothetical protein